MFFFLFYFVWIRIKLSVADHFVWWNTFWKIQRKKERKKEEKKNSIALDVVIIIKSVHDREIRINEKRLIKRAVVVKIVILLSDNDPYYWVFLRKHRIL